MANTQNPEYIESLNRISEALASGAQIQQENADGVLVEVGDAILLTQTQTQIQSADTQQHSYWQDDLLGSEPPPKTQQRARRMSQRLTSLAWKDIYQSIGKGKFKKHIVKDISGYAVSGQVVGIIGPSGCGKTTLLNILANRTRNFSGSVFFNGRLITRNSRDFKQQIGYVIQDDCFLENLTVREQLMYSARLRLPRDYNEEDIKIKVDILLGQLGLTECADTLIGSVLVRGISGGERKRTNIAVELISDPNILFLDEPTSGLDSFTARQTVALCRRLAIDGGRIIVMSIHQPRSDIFDMLDAVMLMSAGETVYYGPGRQWCKDYFGELGYTTPPAMNPADFLLDLVAAENDKRLAGGGKSFSTNVARMVMAYKQKKDQMLPGALLTKQVELEQFDLQKFKKRKNEWAYKSKILLKRSFKNYYRDPRFLIHRVSQSIVTGLIIGAVFFNINLSQTSVQDRMGLLFLIIMNLTFPVATGVIEVFTKERAVFFREKASKMYGTLPYYISKVCSELPLKILELVIQGTIIYWMVGLSHDPIKYFIFLGIIIIQVLIAGTMGLAFSGLCNTSESATTYVSLTLFISITFSGYLRNEANTPFFLVWAKYLSFIRYSFHALAINEFKDLTFTCTEAEKIVGPGGDMICPIPTGEAVLQQSDFQPNMFIYDVIILVGCVVVANFLAFFMLHISARRAQGK